MEKTEAVSRLKKAGYQVQFDSSVVTVLLPGKVNFTQELKKLRNFFAEIGYDASFGIKQVKEVVAEKEAEMLQEEKEGLPQEEKEFLPEEKEAELPYELQEELSFVEMEQFSLEDFGIS